MGCIAASVLWAVSFYQLFQIRMKLPHVLDEDKQISLAELLESRLYVVFAWCWIGTHGRLFCLNIFSLKCDDFLEIVQMHYHVLNGQRVHKCRWCLQSRPAAFGAGHG